MPNPLQSGATPQEAPQQTNALGQAPQSIAPSGAAPGTPPQAMPAPPSHAQTVAALRHFDAIKNELSVLLKDPALGRSDLKDSIIDGVTKLVSERIISAPQAVIQLGQVPADPLLQRKWLQNMMAQTLQAENAIVEHHRNTNLGSGDWATESKMHESNPDSHMDTIKGLVSNYAGGANAGR